MIRLAQHLEALQLSLRQMQKRRLDYDKNNQPG
jgi:hypothetical protein